MRREAAAALNSLSLNDLNKVDMATSDALTQLVALARDDDVPTLRQVCGALANLSECTKTHMPILAAGGTNPQALAEQANAAGDMSLTETVKTDDEPWIADASVAFLNDLVLYNGDVGMVREVSRCLSNLAANHATHDVVLDSDSSVALVRAAERDDAVVARFATIGLLNLATNAKCHARLMEDKACVDVLVDLAGGGERIWTRVDEDGAPSVSKEIEPAPAPLRGRARR